MDNYNIQFHGDYFTLTTTVDAEDPDQAFAKAIEFLKDHYGFDWLESSMVHSWDYDYNGATV
jgi:hypothetical protein